MTGGAENPEAYGIPLRDGLFVGPAIGFVGSLASERVTVRLCPFHPFVDSRSTELQSAQAPQNTLTLDIGIIKGLSLRTYCMCAMPRPRSSL